MTRTGFTLLEVLVALAVLAIVASVAMAFARPAHAVRAANAVRGTLLWARTEAIWRGVPVSVQPTAGPGIALRAEADGAAPWCAGGQQIATLRLSAYPGVALEQGLERGLVWLPTGGARTCSGGGVINGRIRLRDRLRAVDVVVSSLGRVRVAEAP